LETIDKSILFNKFYRTETYCAASRGVVSTWQAALSSRTTQRGGYMRSNNQAAYPWKVVQGSADNSDDVTPSTSSDRREACNAAPQAHGHGLAGIDVDVRGRRPFSAWG
jgi:hypothetical protein